MNGPIEAALELSVVIPTYNRSDLLAIALKSLCEQTSDRALYEIIIVDNNSTDDTRAVAAQFESFGNVRYILETEQGHSAARNRGWREARAPYVGYVDDDCKIPSGWVDAAIEIIHTVKPLCFGGPYLAFYLNEKPKWFKDSYGSHVQADRAGYLTRADQYLSGGNIIFRRATLAALGGFSTDFGMVGKKIGYGDETELLVRLRATYDLGTLYFSPDVFVYHLVRPEKMKWRWILKNNWASGRYYQRMVLLHSVEKQRLYTFLVASKRTFLAIAKIIYSILLIQRRNRTKYPYPQNFLYEVTMNHIREMAMIYEKVVTRA